MPSGDLIQDMRRRATELRTLAETVADLGVRASLLQTAEACERFADREERLRHRC